MASRVSISSYIAYTILRGDDFARLSVRLGIFDRGSRRMQPRLSRSHQGYHAEDFRSLLMLGAYVQLLVIHHYPESPLSVWPCKFDIS